MRKGIVILAGVVLVAGAVPTTSTAATTTTTTTMGSTPSPALLTQGAVTANGAVGGSGNGGNEWGNMKNRVTRTIDGTLFSIYPTASDPSSDKTYTLAKSIDNGSTWLTVDSGHDGGRETPLLLATGNTVYVVIQPYACPPASQQNPAYCTGTGTYGRPVLVGEGVDGAGPRTTTAIPGNWLYSTDHSYSSAAVDTAGNIYVDQNLAQNQVTDAGVGIQLAWTTGGASGSWHFANLPSAATPGSANDVRYVYSFLAPDNAGGIDIAGEDAVDCSNSMFMSANKYLPPSPQTFCYVIDRVVDWHTANLNAAGGPSWTVTPVASNVPGGAVSNTINQFIYLSDVYRDTGGKLHVLTSAGNGDKHTILDNGTITGTGALPAGFCDSHDRLTQDSTGRFYVVGHCTDTSLYVWPADTTNGLTLGPRVDLSFSTPSATYSFIYLVAPRSGVSLQSYVDMVYPTGAHNSGVNFARLRLAAP